MARRKQYIIADATTAFPVIAADGNYPAVGFIDYEGGQGSVFVVGTFGGGTAKLQIQAPDGVTWVDIGVGASFTANGTGGFTAPAGRLRLNVAGSAAPALKAWVVGIPTTNGG